MVTLSPRVGLEPKDSNPLLPTIIATVIICSTLTSVLTGLRLITKRLISTYDLEDYILMAAWVLSIAFDFCLLAAGLVGFGQITWKSRGTRYSESYKYEWALEILYTITIWLAKAALLFQLIRIFSPIKSGSIYWACHLLIWVNLAFYISVFFGTVFQCHPFWKIWKPTHQGHCSHLIRLFVVSSGINVLSDLLILLLPMWTIWHMQMTLKRKAGVIAIFAIGLLAFIFSICRLVYTTRLKPDSDNNHITAEATLWGTAEIAAIILCTCFPMLPRFVQLVRDRYGLSKPSNPPMPIKMVRKSKIFKVGTAQSSTGIGSADVQEAEMDSLKSPYQRLGEEESERSQRQSVVRDLGSKRTVGFEMASRDQINAKSRVASMV